MGEIADMLLDGFLDQETGEMIDGDAPGFPRSAADRSRALNQSRNAAALPFPCPGCGRSFKSKGSRRIHQRDKSH